MTGRDAGAIRFGERMLALLDEGRFVATYKYAVLMAMMDLCLERADSSGEPPRFIHTQDLAAKVIEIYWNQSREFPAASDTRVLRQNNGQQAEIVGLVRRFREEAVLDPSAPLSDARRLARDRWTRLVRNVEWKLIEMPLPKLQRVGSTSEPFIYRIGWGDDVRRSDVNQGRIRPEIEFVGDAGTHLVRLAGLLRPLIQRQWAGMVARFNREVINDAGLEEFLFGARRVVLDRVRRPLRDLQDDRCFYCAEKLGAHADVDHFIPWVRHPDNGIANLVVADPRCNSAKRHHLAAADHLRRWQTRATSTAAGDLKAIAAALGWDEGIERTLGVARAVYLHLPDGATLWRSQGQFEEADHGELAAALAVRKS